MAQKWSKMAKIAPKSPKTIAGVPQKIPTNPKNIGKNTKNAHKLAKHRQKRSKIGTKPDLGPMWTFARGGKLPTGCVLDFQEI